MNPIQAAPKDFTAVRGLLLVSGLFYDDLTPAHLEGFVVVPAADDPARLVAVAGVERFAGSPDALLRSVAVVPELRRCGVGRHLMSAVEARVAGDGVRRLWLLTTSAPDFFRARGYVDTSRAEAPATVQQSGEFKSLCLASAVCLSKPI